MIIENKFDYQPLERIAGPNGREYKIRDGCTYPSVTTILSATKDMTFINEWINSVGEAKANSIKTEAGNIGTNMHNNLERYILGKEMTGQYMGKALAGVIIKHGLSKVNVVWGTEVALHSSKLFAGTTDLTGLWENEPAIMDFKNSIKPKQKEWVEDYFLQCAAYKICHDEMYGTDIQKFVIMLATRDGKYQEFVISGNEIQFYVDKWMERLDKYYNMINLPK